eukprot:Hpha_TRINITY_DN35552_c0_g1::TRINITY_DN35552_c0_g1_i1::g.84499::m.84499
MKRLAIRVARRGVQARAAGGYQGRGSPLGEMVAGRPLDLNQQERYQDYLAAVDQSMQQSDEFGEARRRGRRRGPSSEREAQREQLERQLLGCLQAADTVVSKLRTAAETFWIAQESCLVFRDTTYAALLRYIGSFEPFPSQREVGFDRLHLAEAIYTQVKIMRKQSTEEMCHLMLHILSRSKNDPRLWPKTCWIMKDFEASGEEITGEILRNYAIICGNAGKSRRALELLIRAKAEREQVGERFFPAPSMMTAILSGLKRDGHIPEALALMNTFKDMPVSTVLLTASMNVLAHSDDPLAAFSLYRACFMTGEIQPTVQAFDVLLTAVARCDEGIKMNNILFICQEMRERAVRTDHPALLNRLCISLFAVKQQDLGRDLYRSLKKRHIHVWPVTEECVPEEDRIVPGKTATKRDDGSVALGSVVGVELDTSRKSGDDSQTLRVKAQNILLNDGPYTAEEKGYSSDEEQQDSRMEQEVDVDALLRGPVWTGEK